MARILSPVWSIIRGSIAGTTYTANQFHQIIARARTAPVQPNTNPQTDIKTAFTDAENLWETLSEAVQDFWEDYASATPYSGPLGNYTITGRLMFHAVFGLLLYMNHTMAAGMAATTTAPPTPGFAQMPTFTLGPPDLLATGVRVSATVPIGGDDLFVMGQRSIAFSPSRKRFKGPWVSSSNQAVDFVAGVPTEIDFLFGDVGDILFIHLRGISTDAPHRIAQDIILRGTVVAGV